MQLRALVLLLGIILGAGELRAQPATAPPAGMTQEQFDMLVDAISKSVVEKIKAEGGPAATPDPAKAKSNKGTPPAKAQVVHTPPKQGPGEVALLLQRVGKVVASYPVLGQQLAALGRGLDQRANGGWGAGAFAIIVALVAAIAVGAEWALRGLLRRARRHLASRAGPEHGISSLANLAALVALDAVGLLAVWLICNAAGAWFSSGTVQDSIRRGGVRRHLRLAPLHAADSRRAATGHAAGAALRHRQRPGAGDVPADRGRDAGDHRRSHRGPRPALDGHAGRGDRAPTRSSALRGLRWQAFSGWSSAPGKRRANGWAGWARPPPLAGVIGRHWPGVATSFFVALGATQIYSAVSGRTQVGGAMLLTLSLVIGLLVFETLMQAFVRRLDSQLVGPHAGQRPAEAARCRGALRSRRRVDRRCGDGRGNVGRWRCWRSPAPISGIR